MRAELIVTLDGTPKRVPIVDVLILGRGSKSGVVLDHPAVSRSHCKILKHDDQLTLVDAGSDNGTYVNGRRAQGPTRLLTGDKVRIGPFEMTVQVVAEPLAPEPRVRTLWPPPGAVTAPAERPPVASRVEVVDAIPGADTTAFRDAVRMGEFAVMVLVGSVDRATADRAAVLSEIRRGVRDVAKINGSPDAVMRTLNGSLRKLAATAGAICGRLDLGERRLTYSVVGHDAPWVMRRDQKTTRLPAPDSVELGRVPLARFTQQQTQLADGDVVIFASRELCPLLETAVHAPLPPGTDEVGFAAEWLRRARGQGVSLPWQGGCAICVGMAKSG